MKPLGTSRSTVAPLGTRPAEGTLTAMLRAVLAGHAEAADHQAALRDGVHLAVGADQRRHDQTTAAQALRVADGRHGDVDGLAGLGERRQVGVHGHRGHVLELRVGVRPEW